MSLLYDLAIYFFGFIIRVASLFRSDAKLWIGERRKYRDKINAFESKETRPVWFHIASLGEFEQAIPLIKLIKEQGNQQIVVSFFSPSGFNIARNNRLIDKVFYLPLDTRDKMQFLVDKINPQCLLFVKYDLWYNLISVCQNKSIPIILFSAVAKKSQLHFKSWGGYFRKKLQAFDRIFVQDDRSKNIYDSQGFKNIEVIGDTRIDRVIDRTRHNEVGKILIKFKNNEKLIVLGSSWEEDEKIIQSSLLKMADKGWKIILAPHRLEDDRIKKISSAWDSLGPKLITDVKLGQDFENCRMIILNTIGQLFTVYFYTEVAYIGGGFRTGLHNILEPAAAQCPIIFGPKFEQFVEAKELIELGCAYSIENTNNFDLALKTIMDNREIIQAKLKNYLTTKAGASEVIFRHLKETLRWQ